MSYQVDSYGNAYFPAGVSVASIPATTGTQARVLVPGVNGRISSATVAQLITQSGSNLVSSVYGRTGAVTAALGDYNTDQVTEGQALYFTTDRARKTFSITTFNTSGPATYDSSTGILNIPQYGSASNGNFVPLTRKISINGQTADLSVDRMFSVEEMVYPPIGIPLSNGTSWGASITNNSANWNTAFGWGNHALAGYLTSFTETDPTVPSHVKAITTTNISNWGSAYTWGNHALAGYLTSFTETDPIWTSEKVNYYTKIQADARYLQSYTETDPVWTSEKANYALKTYVDTSISNLIDAAPTALDTLNELAAALGDDANFSTSITTLIGTKEPAITPGTTAQYWRGDKTWQTLPIYTLSGLGGVPTGRTLTINGISYDLSTDRSWSINSMVYPSAGIAVSNGSAWGTSITDNSANWNSAFTDRFKWDGGATGLVAATGRTSLGLGTAATANTGDFAAASHTHSIANVSGLQTALDGKEPTITAGTTSQYWRGDKTWQTLPTYDLSPYVPYTGATANVDLGLYGLTSRGLTISKYGSSVNGLIFEQAAGLGLGGAGYTTIGPVGTDGFGFYFSGATKAFYFSATAITTQRFYSLPDASGTIALTSNIPTLSGLGGVPTTRSLTINGVSYDLSADRSWTISTGISGSGTTNYLSKWTGSTSVGNSVAFDNGSAIGINTASPFESSAFKLDVNGGVIIKNTSGVPAQLILIDSNPATGGNNGFVQLVAGGNTATAFGQWQTYYGTSIASGTLRIQPAGGVVLVGSTTAITGAGLLQVAGDVNITGTFRVNGVAISSGTTLNGTGFVKVSGTTVSYDNSTYYLASNPNGYITGYTETDTLASVTARGASTSTVITLNNNLLFGNSGTTKRGIQGTVGDNDFWFIGGGATASNAGFLEIATGDDGQGASAEPIYVRQYGPGDVLTGTLVRTAALLDASGNTSFPGTVTAPTFSGSLSGNASTATNVAWTGVTGRPTALSSFTNDLGNYGGWITSSGSITGAAGRLSSRDIRTIAPNSENAAELRFGFTSWTNNNNGPWADYLHLRSYSDGSGGSDNLVMFLKSGIGMRIWQQSFGSGTAYSSYVDVLHSSNYSSYAVPLSGGTMTGPLVVSGIDSAIKVQHDGTSTAWRGRIGSFNASADKSSFLGNYTGRPGVFGHNNSLSAWDDLWVNTLGVYGQGNTYLSWFSYVKGNSNDTNYAIWHAGNLTNLNQLSNGPGYITSSATSLTLTGNLTVSSGNTTGGGIILADDGDIVDLNDAYLSLRFSAGVRIFSANRGGSAVITLANTGAISASGNITGANLSGTNTGDQTNISGNAGTVGGFGADTFYRNLGFGSGFPSWNLNTVDENRSGFTYSNNAPWTGPFIYIGASGYGMQFNANYGDGTGLSYRVRNGDNATWQAWRRLMWEGGTWGISITGDAGSVNSRTVGNGKGNIGYFDSNGNLSINNPESYSGEVRLGAAWSRGGVYTSNTLSLSTGSGTIDMVYSDTTRFRYYYDSNGSRLMVNTTSTPYTLIDGETRPVVYVRGRYPVLTLDHTVTTNTLHGPTIQFTFDGLSSRQWVIGTAGNGSQMDFGMSNAAFGNTNYNPHHGIGGYNGKTLMRITETGVLIGDCGTYPTNNTPSFALQVNGAISCNDIVRTSNFRLAGTLVLSGSGAEIGNSTGARLTESYGAVWNMGNSATWHHQVINGSSLCGFNASGGNFGNGNYYGTGDVTAYYSDERLKTKINTITDAIEKIKSLEGFVYVENDLARSLGYTNQKEQAGVSAQQIQAVLPQAVSLAPFDMQGVAETGEVISKTGENYLTVKYDRIVPLLIEGIKEQQLQIEELKKEIKELKNK
jgi:hypothetical protein